MVPEISSPVRPSELGKYYLIALLLLSIFFIMLIAKTIYDIINKTPNHTPQIISNLKTILIVVLLFIIVGFLPSESGVTFWSRFFDSIK